MSSTGLVWGLTFPGIRYLVERSGQCLFYFNGWCHGGGDDALGLLGFVGRLIGLCWRTWVWMAFSSIEVKLKDYDRGNNILSRH